MASIRKGRDQRGVFWEVRWRSAEGERKRRRHPDIRIARRAQTIASLAKVINERQVSKGLRRTLVTQASRLEHLARQRHATVLGDTPEEELGEETGEELAEETGEELANDLTTPNT